MESFAQNSSLDPQLVSAKAYEIWESLGRPEGAAERTWLEAERLLRQSHEQPAVTAASAKSKATTQSEPAAAVKGELSEMVTETVAVPTGGADSEPPMATASATQTKSDPPSAPTSTVQQKKPTGGTKRGSRR